MKSLSSIELALGLLFLLFFSSAAAQSVSTASESHCLMLPLDPANRAQAAALVVEGEVLDARGFWDADHKRIYTAHRVRVYKVFKGTAAAELTVITEGGTVDLKRQELTNTLRLYPGEQGVLFLSPAAFKGIESAGPAWTAYASEQGFIRYDLSTATATEPFRQYASLNQSFYAELRLPAGQSTREVATNVALSAALAQRARPAVAAKGTAPVISGLSPLSITAGTNSVLTITGTGFGAVRGSGFVSFPNADDGGRTQTRAKTSDYISWTDTRIQVRVPSNGTVPSLPSSSDPERSAPAGTGPVRVTSAQQLEGVSGLPLTVVYAVSNVETEGTGEIVRPGHINQNGKGGYTLRFAASFANNAPAVAAFQRALATWRCQSGMNWEIGATSTKRGAEEDKENVIGFDFGTGDTQLPEQVLGRTTSYYEGCRLGSTGTVYFWVSEIDMQLDTETSWQYGTARPTASQIDFESVVVHELGHAQQLSHVILPAAVMHFAVARGQQSRQINPVSDIAGGRFLLRTRSFVPPACGGVSPMLPAPLTRVSANALAGVGNQVNWTTQDECFLGEFVLERAADTTAWQPLATVPQGSTAGQYTYIDTSPLTGRAFYRLRIRRPDNSLDDTRPIAVTTLAGGPVEDGLQLFPNPLEDGPANLLFIGAATGQLNLDIFDAVGRRRRSLQVEYRSGVPFLLDLTDLRSGWYVLRWRDQTGKKGTVQFVRAPQ